jgi:hypothetical protein
LVAGVTYEPTGLMERKVDVELRAMLAVEEPWKEHSTK